MTAEKNPFEDALEQVVDQTLDAFVYAPIGLLFDGPARPGDLVRNGRNQVTNARMMGQFTVQMGKNEVTRRVGDLDGPVLDLLRGLGLVPGATPAPTPTDANVDRDDDRPAARADAGATAAAAVAEAAPAKPAKKAAKKKAATRRRAATTAATNEAAADQATAARNAATDAATPAVSTLPIPDYDSLSASQVVSRLRGLSDGELDAVRAYETATRGRKTILNRVQQLRKQ